MKEKSYYIMMYRLFFRFLKESGIYHEFISYGRDNLFNPSSPSSLLDYLSIPIECCDFGDLINYIDGSFNWIENRVYFGTMTDWGQHSKNWIYICVVIKKLYDKKKN